MSFGAIGRLLTWEACKFPERPPDMHAEFAQGCRGCAVALRVAITTPPPPGEFDGWYRERDTITPLLDRWPAMKAGSLRVKGKKWEYRASLLDGET